MFFIGNYALNGPASLFQDVRLAPDPELEFSEAIHISQQHPILVISWQPA